MKKSMKQKIFLISSIVGMSIVTIIPITSIISQNTNNVQNFSYYSSNLLTTPTLKDTTYSVGNLLIPSVSSDVYSIDIENDESLRESIINFMNKYPALFLENHVANAPITISQFKNYNFTVKSSTVITNFDYLTSYDAKTGDAQYTNGTITFTGFNSKNTMLQTDLSLRKPFFLSTVQDVDASNILDPSNIEIVENAILNNLSDIFVNYSQTFINKTLQKVKITNTSKTDSPSVMNVTFEVNYVFSGDDYTTKSFTVAFSGFRTIATPELITSINISSLDIKELNGNVSAKDVVDNVSLQQKIIDKMNEQPHLFIKNYINLSSIPQFTDVKFFLGSNNSLSINCNFLTSVSNSRSIGIYSNGNLVLTGFGAGTANSDVPITNNNSFTIDNSTMWIIIVSVISGLLLIALLILLVRRASNRKSRRSSSIDYYDDSYF